MSEKIIIDDSLYNTTDEQYADFYNCPNCKFSAIISEAKYCSECGFKIEWKLTPRELSPSEILVDINIKKSSSGGYQVIEVYKDGSTIGLGRANTLEEAEQLKQVNSKELNI